MKWPWRREPNGKEAEAALDAARRQWAAVKRQGAKVDRTAAATEELATRVRLGMTRRPA